MDAQTVTVSSRTPQVTVRYWAGARAAAGLERETFEASSLTQLHELAVERHPALESVLPLCSFLMDGLRLEAGAELKDGAVVEALPPFAGG